ncbi:MAG: UDP-N-acetylmuramate dehydrogenase [Myxococcota bacterium]|jgi:UDP-N-acetylmuramate dehydrogenase
MALALPLVDALEAAEVPVVLDAPLAKRTWWRTGGTADGLVMARTAEAVEATSRLCAAHDTPLFVLGNASNLLVSDRGIRGVVLRLAGDLAAARAVDGGRLWLGGGLRLVSLVKRMQREGWTGLEMLAGIPGTVGGAVRMNAGTRLGEIGDVLESVVLVHAGRARTVPAADLGLAYRTAHIGPAGTIVQSAIVRLSGGDVEASRASIAEHLAYRERTQPVNVPTIGSTFRNPPGDAAGRLIDAAGLKGARIGAAEVSEKHANFLVNTGGASADDLRRLIEHVQQEVLKRHGVQLQREVHYAGDWSHWGA